MMTFNNDLLCKWSDDLIWYLIIADFLDYYDRHLRFIDKVQHVNVLEIFFLFSFQYYIMNQFWMTQTHTHVLHIKHISI